MADGSQPWKCWQCQVDEAGLDARDLPDPAEQVRLLNELDAETDERCRAEEEEERYRDLYEGPDDVAGDLRSCPVVLP